MVMNFKILYHNLGVLICYYSLGISNLSEMKEDDLSLGNKPKRNDGGPIEPEDLDIKKFNVEKNVSIFQRPAIFRNRKRKYRQGLVKERLIEVNINKFEKML